MTSSWRANSLGSRFWIQKDLGEYSPGSNIKFYFRIKKIYIIQVQDEEEVRVSVDFQFKFGNLGER